MQNPKLRFTDTCQIKFADWSETSLGAETIWASGGTPPKNDQANWGGHIPWVSASSMRGIRFSDSEHKVTTDGLKNGSKLAPVNSLLLLVRGSMLFNKIPVGLAARDLAFNQDVKCIIPKQGVIPEFLLYWFLAAENKLLNMVTGTGIGAGKLDTNELQEMRLVLPSLAEQQKIASFLSAVDQKISLLTKKHELLVQYKRGVMQKIFNQEIRFKDKGRKDFPEWMKFTFAEAFKIANSKELQIQSSKYLEHGGVPIVDQSQKRIAGWADSNLSYKNIPVIIFGDHTRVIKWIDFEFRPGADGTQIIKTNDGFDPKFCYYAMENIELPNLGYSRHLKELKGATFFMPKSRDEQTKVSSFLTKVDLRIAKQAEQLELIKLYKQGLLQQMFI